MTFEGGRRSPDDAWDAAEPAGRIAQRLADEIARQELESRRVAETSSYRYQQEPEYRAEVDERYARVDAAVAEAEALDQIAERQHFQDDVKLLAVVGGLLVAGVAVALAFVTNERPGLAGGTLCCAVPILVAIPVIMLRTRARRRKRESRDRMKAARTPERRP